MATFNVATLEAIFKLRDEMSPQLPKIHQQLDQLAGTMMRAGTVLSVASAGMFATGVSAVKMAGQLEQTKIGFTQMLGSAEKATAHLKQLEDFAAKTPFRFTELTDNSLRLQAMGFEAQKVVPMLTAIGDAAAATGKGSVAIDRITYAIGQMQAKGKISSEEMSQQLGELIPAWQLMAKEMGVSVAKAQDMVKKGQIDVNKGIEALIEGMRKKYGGVMADQAKTLLGQMSTLQDNFESMMRRLGTALLPIAMDLLRGLQALLPIVEKAVKAFSDLPEPVRYTVVAVAALAAAIGPILVTMGLMIQSLSALGLGYATAKAAVLAFTPSLWTMQTAALSATAALSQLAMAGAAAFIGWKIGELINDLTGLDQKIADVLTSPELKAALEKGDANDYGDAVQGRFRRTSYSDDAKGEAEWRAEVQKSKAEMDALRNSFAAVSAEKAKAVVVTDSHIRSMMSATKEQEILAKASAAYGEKITDVAFAQRVLGMSDEAIKKSANEAREAREKLTAAMIANFDAISAARSEREGRSEARESFLGQFGPSAEQASTEMARLAVAFEDLGTATGDYTDEQLANLVQKMQEQIALGGTSEEGFLMLAKVMELAATRGDALAAKVGFATKKTATGIREVVVELERWQRAMLAANAAGDILAGLGSVFDALGISAEHGIGMVVSGMEDLASAVGDGAKAFGQFQSGNIVGGIKSSLSAIAGAISGGKKLINGIFGNAEEMKVNDMRDAWIEAAGGFEALAKKAGDAAPNLDLVKRLLDADTVAEYEAAIRDLEGAFDDVQEAMELHEEAQGRLNDAIERYGFEVSELGGLAQGKLDELGMGLFQDFELLTEAGVNLDAVIERMGPHFNDYVNQVVASGASIPAAMRPVIEKMIEERKLLDENGDAYESVEEAGLTFAETMTEAVGRLTDEIKRMVDALLGVNDVRINPINVPLRQTYVGDDESGPGPHLPGHASGFYHPSLPADYPFIAHRGERIEITPASQTPARNMRDMMGWNGGIRRNDQGPIVLKMEGRTVATQSNENLRNNRAGQLSRARRELGL